MDEYLYKQQLAQQLQKDFQSSHFAQLPAQKQLNVKANVAYLLGGDAFGGRLFFLLDGRVVLIKAIYGPANLSWAFHPYQVHSEGRSTVGNLAGHRPRDLPQNCFFINNLKVTGSGDYENKGLASFMLTMLLAFCAAAEITLIEGKIVKNDWAEADKLAHLYSKFGFVVTLDRVRQCGDIKREQAAA